MRHLLFLHLLGASVWVGGHLVLLFSVLPGALRRRDVQPVRQFEQLYERVGIPALLVQIVSGSTAELDEALDRIGAIDGIRSQESLIHLTTKLDRAV